MPLNRKIKYGMVGGGPGSFIGAVHRRAAALDGEIELVAGAFSSSPEKSKQTGKELGLDPKRVYDSYKQMAEEEAKLPEGERIDFVSITTPNYTHFDIAKTFIEAGFSVICDKPMTTTLEDAEELCRLVKKHDIVFALTHNYTGYPMVKQAKELVKNGTLGKIRKVVVEYPQGWLATRIEAKGQKQASWRTNPRNTGTSCCMSDVASIAYDLAVTITGLTADEVCADISTFVNGRMLDDDGVVLIRYANGARGLLWATQIGIGEIQALKIRVYGEKASLTWKQSAPYTLTTCPLDGTPEIKSCESPSIEERVNHSDDIPPGHPDTSVEPLVAIYRNFAQTLTRLIDGEKLAPEDITFQSISEGLRTARFTEAAIANANSEEKWTKVISDN